MIRNSLFSSPNTHAMPPDTLSITCAYIADSNDIGHLRQVSRAGRAALSDNNAENWRNIYYQLKLPMQPLIAGLALPQPAPAFARSLSLLQSANAILAQLDTCFPPGFGATNRPNDLAPLTWTQTQDAERRKVWRHTLSMCLGILSLSQLSGLHRRSAAVLRAALNLPDSIPLNQMLHHIAVQESDTDLTCFALELLPPEMLVDPEIEARLQRLSNGLSDKRRERLGEILGAAAHHRDVQTLLLRWLAAAHPMQQKVALLSLKKAVPNAALTESLVLLLQNEDLFVRVAALDALAATPPDARTTPALLACFADADDFVKAAAARALKNSAHAPLIKAALLAELRPHASAVLLCAVISSLSHLAGNEPDLLDAILRFELYDDEPGGILVRAAVADAVRVAIAANPAPELVTRALGMMQQRDYGDVVDAYARALAPVAYQSHVAQALITETTVGRKGRQWRLSIEIACEVLAPHFGQEAADFVIAVADHQHPYLVHCAVTPLWLAGMRHPHYSAQIAPKILPCIYAGRRAFLQIDALILQTQHVPEIQRWIPLLADGNTNFVHAALEELADYVPLYPQLVETILCMGECNYFTNETYVRVLQALAPVLSRPNVQQRVLQFPRKFFEPTDYHSAANNEIALKALHRLIHHPQVLPNVLWLLVNGSTSVRSAAARAIARRS